MAKEYLNEWETIVNSIDLKKSLTDHFSYLAQDENDFELLKMIMQKVEKATCDKHVLKIYFSGIENEYPLEASTPSVHIQEHFPENYKALLSVHSQISFYDLVLGEDNFKMTENDLRDLAESGDLGHELASEKNLVSPLRENTDIYFVYSGRKKNVNGYPMLYQITLDDPLEITSMQNQDAGCVFLKILANYFGLYE